jgi:Carboxypeptidase regulatory-like domain
MMRKALLIAVAIHLAQGISSAQEKVVGTVTNSEGASVAGSLVGAFPSASKPDGSVVGDRPNPWATTDADGKFTISLPPGHYRIRAKDEADGYPDPIYWLNADPTAKFPEITVETKDVSDVHVVLGKRGGVLSGELIEQGSHAPIAKGKVTIRDARNANAYVEVFSDKGGHFRFTVPSKPLAVSASAAGYQAASFAGGAAITLLSGEHEEIVIELPKE